MMARTTRRRRFLCTLLLLSFGAVFAMVGGLWFTFQHRPPWYQPVTPDEATLQAARRESAAVADSTSRSMVEGEMFEVALSDAAVNRWLAALPSLWPDVGRRMPAGLRDPAVSFDEGEMRIGGFYEDRGWRVIANAAIVPELTDAGATITLRLAAARGGSLPLPRNFLERAVRQLRRRADEAVTAPDGDDEFWSAMREIRTVDDLFRGVSFKNRFVWPNGERAYRIDAINARDGVLRLRIDPL